MFSPSSSKSRPSLPPIVTSGRRPRRHTAFSSYTPISRSPSSVQTWLPTDVAEYIEANAPPDMSPQISSFVLNNRLSGHAILHSSIDDIVSEMGNNGLTPIMLEIYSDLRGPFGDNGQRRRPSISQLMDELVRSSPSDSSVATVQPLQDYHLDHRFWSESDGSETEDSEGDPSTVPPYDHNTPRMNVGQIPPITAEQPEDHTEPTTHAAGDAPEENRPTAAIHSGSNVSSSPADIDNNISIPQDVPAIFDATSITTVPMTCDDVSVETSQSAEHRVVDDHHMVPPSDPVPAVENLPEGVGNDQSGSVQVADIIPAAPGAHIEGGMPLPPTTQQSSEVNDPAVSVETSAADSTSDYPNVVDILSFLSSLVETVSVSSPGLPKYSTAADSHLNTSSSDGRDTATTVSASSESDVIQPRSMDLAIPETTTEGADVEHLRSPPHEISHNRDPDPTPISNSFPDPARDVSSGPDNAVGHQPESTLVSAEDVEGVGTVGSGPPVASLQPFSITFHAIAATPPPSRDDAEITDMVMPVSTEMGLVDILVHQPDHLAASQPIASTTSQPPEQVELLSPMLAASQADQSGTTSLFFSLLPAESYELAMGLAATPSSLLQSLRGDTETPRLEPLTSLPLGNLHHTTRDSNDRHNYQLISAQDEPTQAAFINPGVVSIPTIHPSQLSHQLQMNSEHAQVGVSQLGGYLLLEDAPATYQLSQRYSLQYLPRSGIQLILAPSFSPSFALSSLTRALRSTARQQIAPSVISLTVTRSSSQNVMMLQLRPSPPQVIRMDGRTFVLTRDSTNVDEGIVDLGDLGTLVSSSASIGAVDEEPQSAEETQRTNDNRPEEEDDLQYIDTRLPISELQGTNYGENERSDIPHDFNSFDAFEDSDSRAPAHSFDIETPMTNQDTLVNSPQDDRFDMSKFSPMPTEVSTNGQLASALESDGGFFEDADMQLVDLSDVDEELEIISDQEPDSGVKTFLAVLGGDIFGASMIPSLSALKDKQEQDKEPQFHVIGIHLIDSITPSGALRSASTPAGADHIARSVSNEMMGTGDYHSVGQVQPILSPVEPVEDNFHTAERSHIVPDSDSEPIMQGERTHVDVATQTDSPAPSQSMLEERFHSAVQRSAAAPSSTSTRRRAHSDPIPPSAMARLSSWSSYPEYPVDRHSQ